MAATERQKKKQFPIMKAVEMTALLVVILLLGFWYLHRGKGAIRPGRQAPASQSVVPGHWVVVKYLPVKRSLEAVGTVTPIDPVKLAARISGRVVQTELYDGEKVRRGQMLVRLDDTRLKAQLAATAALAQMAKARLHQALIDQRRDRKLLATGDVTRAAMDLADTAVATDQAAVANAIAAEHSAATLLRHTRIISPISGIVTQKMVSVGDTVMPGEVLADLYNPAQLELDATVRESLANRLRRGEKLPVELTGFASPIIGSVRQIVPRVSTQTRSFIVKISASFPRGAWPGVFGHVRVPIGTRRVLVVPQTAIQYVGQLSIVDISLDGRRRMQAIQTGRKIGSDREVLSGLQAGQRVWMVGRAGAGHSTGKKSG